MFERCVASMIYSPFDEECRGKTIFKPRTIVIWHLDYFEHMAISKFRSEAFKKTCRAYCRPITLDFFDFKSMSVFRSLYDHPFDKKFIYWQWTTCTTYSPCPEGSGGFSNAGSIIIWPSDCFEHNSYLKIFIGHIWQNRGHGGICALWSLLLLKRALDFHSNEPPPKFIRSPIPYEAPPGKNKNKILKLFKIYLFIYICTCYLYARYDH